MPVYSAGDYSREQLKAVTRVTGNVFHCRGCSTGVCHITLRCRGKYTV